jgi:6-hydroxy-3-succinoylpyridine 3-monooxygenase
MAGSGNLYDCPSVFMAANAAGAPVPPPKPRPRTIVYIDGFNLYYGAVRDVPALKWLDLERYCKLLRPHDDIQVVRYFTALVTGPTKSHQEAYLKALATTPHVNVILGKFKDKSVKCGVTACTHAAIRIFKVPEEKRTDVNIAISMLDDAYQKLCDHMVLFSGDSDLVPAVNMVRLRFPTMTITVYVPSRNPIRGAAVELRLSASKHRNLPLQFLSKAQFADAIPDGSGGTINRPAAWR